MLCTRSTMLIHVLVDFFRKVVPKRPVLTKIREYRIFTLLKTHTTPMGPRPRGNLGRRKVFKILLTENNGFVIPMDQDSVGLMTKVECGYRQVKVDWRMVALIGIDKARTAVTITSIREEKCAQL